MYINSTTLLAVIFGMLVMWGVAIVVFTINLSHEDGVGMRLRGGEGVGGSIETTPSGDRGTTAYSETATTTPAAATAAVSRHLKTHIFYYPW